MGLAAMQGRMLALTARQNKMEQQIQKTEYRFANDKECFNKCLEVDKEIDVKYEDLPSNMFISNLGINFIRTNTTDVQINKTKEDKNVSLDRLKTIKYQIIANEHNIENSPTERSQEDIQKDLDKLNKQIEKAPKKYKTETQYPGVSKTTYKKENGKKTWSVTLQDGTVNTFKSEKEYNKFLKKYAKKVKVQVETPQLKKLNEQKQKLQAELTSAKSRDELPKLQEQAEQLENQIAKYDEKLKELEAKKEEEKASEKQEDDEVEITFKTFDDVVNKMPSEEEKRQQVLDRINPQQNETTSANDSSRSNFKSFGDDETKSSSTSGGLSGSQQRILAALERAKANNSNSTMQARKDITSELENVKKIIDDNIEPNFKDFA